MKRRKYMQTPEWMLRNRDLITGAFAGLVLGLPQGLRDLPQFTQTLGSTEEWGAYVVLGAFMGFFAGVHLYSRANPSLKKRTMFSLLMVGSFSIGIPTVLRHFNGELFSSFTLPGALFTSLGIAMLLGASVSHQFSKTIKREFDE